MCRTQTPNCYVVTNTQECDQNLQWLRFVSFWEGYLVYSVTTCFEKNIQYMLPFKCFSLYVEASKKYKLIFIQVSVPFQCIISTAEDSN